MSEQRDFQTIINRIPVEMATSGNLALVIEYNRRSDGAVMVKDGGVRWVDRNKTDILTTNGRVVIGWNDNILPGDFQSQFENPFGDAGLTMGVAVASGKELFIGATLNTKAEQVPGVFYKDRNEAQINDENNW